MRLIRVVPARGSNRAAAFAACTLIWCTFEAVSFSAAHAQPREDEAPGAFVYVGHVRSRILDAAVPFTARSGLAIGLSQPVLRTGAFSLSVEPAWVQKGGRPTAIGPNLIEDVRIDYIELHILAQARSPWRLGPVHPRVSGGFVLSWQGKCSFGFADGEDRSRSCGFAGLHEIGLESALDDYDYAWEYGAGVDFRVPPVGVFVLGARFTTGTGKFIVGPTQSRPRHTTRVIILGLAIQS